MSLGPALAALLAVSAVLVSGLVERVAGAQAGRSGAPAPTAGAQTQGPDDPATGKPVAIDPLTGKASTGETDVVPGTGAKSALSTSRVFASEAGVILTPVKTARVKDFEMVIARIHEALAQSTDPARQQQAAGWKVYRAAEPGPGGSVLFVFLMSPAVKGADYTIGKILLEAFPLEEVQEIFEAYTQAFAGPQSLLSLRMLDDFSQPAPPRRPDPMSAAERRAAACGALRTPGWRRRRAGGRARSGACRAA